MPAAFDSCVKRGGRVRTKKVGKDKFMHICFIDNKSFAGEVKTRKSKQS